MRFNSIIPHVTSCEKDIPSACCCWNDWRPTGSSSTPSIIFICNAAAFADFFYGFAGYSLVFRQVRVHVQQLCCFAMAIAARFILFGTNRIVRFYLLLALHWVEGIPPKMTADNAIDLNRGSLTIQKLRHASQKAVTRDRSTI